MRRITATVITLALFIIPSASTHMVGAEPAPYTQNQKPTTAATQTDSDTTPPPTATPSPVIVTVQPGDTLRGIAAANNTTYDRLYDANSFITNPDLIYSGQQIRIPGNNEQLVDRISPTPTVITIQPGNTLNSIATANNTTVQRLYDANPSISNPNVIYPGKQVAIPTSNEQLVDRTMAAATPVAPAPATAPPTVTTAATVPAPAIATTVSATNTNTPDSAAKAYIYEHESSNNPDATNTNGCYGLGQDCSGKLKPLCGDNYACQDAFFDNYAQQRYGGWNNALAFWEAHHWW